MSKYIDADLLSAEIKRLKQDNTISDDKEYAQYELDVACGYDMALEKVFLILNSLTEQPVEEVSRPIPRCGIGRHFFMVEKTNKERPVEGLEEEIDSYVYKNGLVNCSEIVPVAHHFAEWGAKNAKQ